MDNFNGGKFLVSIFAGFLAFFMFYFLITFMLGHLGVTPYGKFNKEYFGGKDRAITQALIKDNPEKYKVMLDEKTKFDNMFMTPWAGFMACILVGVIGGNFGVAASMVTASLLMLMLTSFGYLAGDPAKSFLIFVFIALSTIGGVTGQFISPLVKTFVKEQNEIDDAKRAEIRAKALEVEKEKEEEEKEDTKS